MGMKKQVLYADKIKLVGATSGRPYITKGQRFFVSVPFSHALPRKV